MHCKAPNNHRALNGWKMHPSNLYSPLWGLFGTHRGPKGSIFAGKNLPGWKATERPKALQDPLAKWATLIIAFKTIFRPQLFTRCIMFPANHLIFSWQISQIRLWWLLSHNFLLAEASCSGEMERQWQRNSSRAAAGLVYSDKWRIWSKTKLCPWATILRHCVS